MKLPNAIFGPLLIALTTIINSEYSEFWWAPVALALIVAVGKLIEVNVADPTIPVDPDQPVALPRGDTGATVTVQPSGKVRRFFLE